MTKKFIFTYFFFNFAAKFKNHFFITRYGKCN